MWKAFTTVFIIGTWGMIFIYALLLGTLFIPVPNSVVVIWKILLFALLNIPPAWALWALCVTTWTEHQNLAIKVGLIIGILFIAVFAFNAAQHTTHHGNPIAVTIRQVVALPFFMLTFACLAWELRKQFKVKDNNQPRL